jgi:hypothetical protein
MNPFSRIFRGTRERLLRWRGNRSILRKAEAIQKNALPKDQPPVVFFNASTRIRGLSLNAAFSMLSAWSLRLQGIPVVHFVCDRGMTLCVMGTNNKDEKTPLPCQECLEQSKSIYHGADVCRFSFERDERLDTALEDLKIDDLSHFIYQDVPLGELVLPSVRWILRRHHLADDEKTIAIYKQYIRSAWSICRSFSQLLDELKPQSVVVFNGMLFPEATVRWVAAKQGIPSFSHEVGIAPTSVFFTAGSATAYPVDIPDSFQLTTEQNNALDTYLSKRFKGDFSMAGVKFWPKMSRLDTDFMKMTEKFKQIVPVFTNVIFDTSQPHANVVFPHMFTWLDEVLDIAEKHPETLFIFRAHPDESRPGKASQESVSDWAKERNLGSKANIVFIGPNQYFSSYEMIQRAKFIMIYNSTIGLEASIMGAAVLCAGKARFTQLDTVFFPRSATAFRMQAESFLNAEKVFIPAVHRENARRFLYFQIYRTSLPFDAYIQPDGIWNGFVRLKRFPWQALLPENSPTMAAISDGILEKGDFLLKE